MVQVVPYVLVSDAVTMETSIGISDDYSQWIRNVIVTIKDIGSVTNAVNRINREYNWSRLICIN